MTESTERTAAKPRLYHTPSSYYSMIARLALAEGGVAYDPVFVDIHFRRSQQRPDYVRFNPNMTVPTLALANRMPQTRRDHPRSRVLQLPLPGAENSAGGADGGAQCGRGIKLDPAYVDVAVRRWQTYAGKAATLVATRQTFEEVAEQRALAAPASCVENRDANTAIEQVTGN